MRKLKIIISLILISTLTGCVLLRPIETVTVVRELRYQIRTIETIPEVKASRNVRI